MEHTSVMDFWYLAGLAAIVGVQGLNAWLLFRISAQIREFREAQGDKV